MSAILESIKRFFLGLARGAGDFYRSIVNWLKMAYSPNPYYRGNIITGTAVGGRAPFEGNLRMVIAQVFQPSDWTVLEVAVLRPSGTPFKAVLKLFDRRFSPCIQRARQRRGLGAWTPEFEEEFVDYVRRGAANEYLWGSDSDEEDDDDFKRDEADEEAGGEGEKKPVNLLEEEVIRQSQCDGIANARLNRLQSRMGVEKGIRLPKAHCTVQIPVGGDVDNRLLEVSGILMEYVPGFSCDDTE
ncbi:hypothetical protein CABS01_12566 [Colletotrichum abscissum]|uniref:Uncharacterized protein n=3 Tax=Colletotrichum acutatum species complex TaxID=2707335 RepID=A0A9P9XCN3_9PEZI|nr:uncharacterized protein CTAM01_07821 [Colletotrichum tamarilloi]XP_060396454.1 uncharacterized protein CABS01_12566 [Colletotrichum abscissum]KAI3549732.1 hypothetical protein CABS02_07835 [Colletotrichum abscissum]KAK1489985.1 hypothetical protein CABS01_12566 [Colletotrichum abscissum]KAK1497551.1 hypothetical protein CTAM01_07821 [Colletotrichum tamarilloi]